MGYPYATSPKLRPLVLIAALGVIGTPVPVSAQAPAAGNALPAHGAPAPGDRLDRRFLETAEPDAVLSLVESETTDLTRERRRWVADRLVARFARDEATLSRLEPARFLRVREVVLGLDGRDEARRPWS